MIVIVYSFSILSFIQTFQWIREFNLATADLFRDQIGWGEIDIEIPFFFLYLFNLKQTGHKVVLT